MSNKIEIIRMPKLGMSMTEAKITEWHYHIGDTVSAGDEIVEVTTEKITNSVCCTQNGILRRILIQVDETAKVEDALAIIANENTKDSEIDAALNKD